MAVQADGTGQQTSKKSKSADRPSVERECSGVTKRRGSRRKRDLIIDDGFMVTDEESSGVLVSQTNDAPAVEMPSTSSQTASNVNVPTSDVRQKRSRKRKAKSCHNVQTTADVDHAVEVSRSSDSCVERRQPLRSSTSRTEGEFSSLSSLTLSACRIYRVLFLCSRQEYRDRGQCVM